MALQLPRLRALAIYLIFGWSSLRLERVAALRGVKGCYDDYPMSCKQHKVSLEDIPYSTSELQQICNQIETEVFENENVLILGARPQLRPPFLNRIEASDPFCTKMQQAYSHCAFCFRDFAQYERCFFGGTLDLGDCIRKPKLEEIIQDQDIYSDYNSREDIDTTCAELENANKLYYSPKTRDLCEKQAQVGHLCADECEIRNPCFASEPTCDKDSERNNNNTDPSWKETCEGMQFWIGYNFGRTDFFNTSSHLDYLEIVPEDNENCTEYREAYPHCLWCQNPADVLCFDETRPLSCDVPENDTTDMTIIELDSVCNEIHFSSYSPATDFVLPNNETIDMVAFHSKYAFILENSTLCHQARQVYHKCIWCDPRAQDLPFTDGEICASNLSLPKEYDTKVLERHDIYNNSTDLTEEECDQLHASWFYNSSGFPGTVEGLYEAIAAFNLCPDAFCKTPEPEQPAKNRNYLGTTSDAQREALVWISRASAFLSFLGASFILFDILTNAKARTTVYHGILIGMASFDIVTAVAWAFATAPVYDRRVEGATGNEATCKAQAFFVQLGSTSVFYNVSLAVYYVLVITYSWREFQLKKIGVYLHAVPVTIGVVLALGAIPMYGMLEYGCHLEPPGSDHGKLWSVLVFVVLPLGISILAITGCMVTVYWSVRKQAQKAKKWNLGSGHGRTSRAGKMERAVFWQCLSYALAFYITWPIMFSVYLFSFDEDGPFGLAVVVAFVAPLQGFSNSVVYIRTKLTNQRNSEASSRRKSWFSNVFSKFIRRSPSPSDNSGLPPDRPEEDEVGLFSEMDPSAALVLYRDRISEREASQRSSAQKQPIQDTEVASATAHDLASSGKQSSTAGSTVPNAQLLGSIQE